MNLQEELESFEEINVNFLEDYDDDIKESFRLYNNAVNYVKNNSEDIALICLKKSVALNNSFSEALNLMALLYINIKDYNASLNCVKKVLKIDKESSKANKYLEVIKEYKGEVPKDNDNIKGKNVREVDNNIKSKNGKSVNNKNNSKTNKKKKTSAKRKRDRLRIISISFFGVAVIIILFIVIGSIGNNSKNDIGSNKNTAKKISSKNNEYVLNEGESLDKANISSKQSKVKSKKKNTKKAKGIPSPTPSISASPKPMASPSPLPKAVAMAPAPGNPLVNRKVGKSYYDRGNYTKAIPYLESYIRSANKDQYAYYDLYYLIRAYHTIGNKARAKELYNTLKVQYPGNEMITYASGWINR